MPTSSASELAPAARISGVHLPALLVRNRNFLLLWCAYGISAVGDHLSELALLTERHALEGDHATRIQALITFGFFLPFPILGPLAGWWADRFSRKWTMIVSDIIRAGIMLSLIWTVRPLIAWLEPHGLGDYAIVLPLLLTGALAAFFSPARQALLPTLIRPNQIVRANAMISALGTIGTIASAVLGGYIVKHLGQNWNYSLDAVTFLISAALLLGLTLTRTRQAPPPQLDGMWAPLKDGFRYVFTHRRVLQMILLGTVFWAAAGIVISVVPALVRDVFGGDIADAGLYRGLLGVGLALGAAVMTIIGPALGIPLSVLAGLAAGTFWLFALAAIVVFRIGAIPAGICLVGIGGAGAALLVTVMATIQRFVPNSRRGRVFGVSDMATMAALVLATGLLGVPDIPHIDRYVPLLIAIAGGGLAIALVISWRHYRRGRSSPAVVYVLHLLVTAYARFWLRTKRIGPCTVPREGPVLLALNHTAGVDPMAVYATCSTRIPAFLVAEKYYKMPVVGWFQRLAGCVPVDREKPGRRWLDLTLERLAEGNCVAIFPQGTYRPPDERPLPAKPGIGVIALRSGATVIPAHISGAHYVKRPLDAYLQRHDIRVRYGPPVDLSDLPTTDKGRDRAQEATDRIMRRIFDLAPPPGASDG